MRHQGYLAALLLLVATSAGATNYFVDPLNGDDTNTGTAGPQCSPAPCTGPWKTPPGTRNTANTAYIGTEPGAWGAVNNTNAKIACGDTIFLRGGRTYSTSTVSNAGAWCIGGGADNTNSCNFSGSYYTANCTAANPITIRVATSGEFSGSSGDFVFDATGITPAGIGFPTDFDSAIAIGGMNGLVLGGVSTSQRLEVKNVSGGLHKGNIVLASGNNQNAMVGMLIQYFNVHHSSNGPGIAMGKLQDSVIAEGWTHDNGATGINCGLGLHHNCLRVGWVNIEVGPNNGALQNSTNPGVCASYGDAMYIQGAQRLFVVGVYNHDNYCVGLNIGAGDHVYPYRAVTLLRNMQFINDGRLATTCSARVGYQGGGKYVPAEDPAIAAGGRFDPYSFGEFILTYKNSSAGVFAHHGSGYSELWHAVGYKDCQLTLTPCTGNGCGTGNCQCDGHFRTDVVAADNGIFNSILIRNQIAVMLDGNSNAGCAGVGAVGIPTGCKVCDSRCSNPGVLCTSDSQCLNCGGAGSGTGSGTTCSTYHAKPNITHTLLRPASSDTEGLTNFRFQCNSTCSNSGTDCKKNTDCAGCSGGCTYIGTGSTFATPPAFLNGASNKIGLAFNPRFTDITSTNCAGGTLDWTTCNFHLEPNSDAIDAGGFFLMTSPTTPGSSTTILPVFQAQPHQGLNMNARAGDPTNYFIEPGAFLNAYLYALPGGVSGKGDLIKIQDASCAAGTPTLSDPSTAYIVSMTSVDHGDASNSITLDRNCSWGLSKGIHLATAYNGFAPDMGLYETAAVGGATTSTSTSTSSTSTSSTSSTTTSSLAGNTSTTTSTSSSSTSTTATSTTTSIPAGPRQKGVTLRGIKLYPSEAYSPSGAFVDEMPTYECDCLCTEMSTTTTSSSSSSVTSSSTTSSTLPADGTCIAPFVIPPAGGVFHGTTSGTSALAGTCNVSNNSPEQVYIWTPVRSGVATVETCSTTETTFDTVVYLKDGGCAGTQLACNDDVQGCGTTTDVSNPHRGSRFTTPVTAGRTYVLVVDGYNGGKGNYRLAVTSP